jgi:hypothetical protein
MTSDRPEGRAELVGYELHSRSVLDPAKLVPQGDEAEAGEAQPGPDGERRGFGSGRRDCHQVTRYGVERSNRAEHLQTTCNGRIPIVDTQEARRPGQNREEFTSH